jgi:hypothetical protein
VPALGCIRSSKAQASWETSTRLTPLPRLVVLWVPGGSPLCSQGLVASTGFDKALRLSNLSSGLEMGSCLLPANGWACCWDVHRLSLVHTALDNGDVLVGAT